MYNISNAKPEDIEIKVMQTSEPKNYAPLKRFCVHVHVKTPDGWGLAGRCIVYKILSKWFPRNKFLVPKNYNMMDALANYSDLLYVAYELGCKEGQTSVPHNRLYSSNLYVVYIRDSKSVSGGKEFLAKHLKDVIKKKFAELDPFIVTLPSEYISASIECSYPRGYSSTNTVWLKANGFDTITTTGSVTMYLK
jgi:hypothetical protein